MTNPHDRRSFPRIAAGIRVAFRPQRVDALTLRYLDSVAEDVSLGGMFLATTMTFRPGTVIELQFEIAGPDGGSDTIQARAIVRWRQRWRRPRGMGIEFVELGGLGRSHLETWMRRLVGSGESQR